MKVVRRKRRLQNFSSYGQNTNAHVDGKPGLRGRFRYWLESFIAKGGKSMFISLFVLFMLFLVISLIVRFVLMTIYGETIEHVIWDAWNVFLYMTDPGSMGIASDEPGAIYKVSAIVAGILGVIIFSMLIAFITTQLDVYMAELKKGHSRVLERDHTLILGWNERVPDIIRELVIANESQRKPRIVILAEEIKEMMDDELKSVLDDTKNTKIVTRNGVTSSLKNLEKVAVMDARSAIVLASCAETAIEEEKQTSDARVIKTILALIASTQGKRQPLNIVAEVFDQKKQDLLSVIESNNIKTVDSWNILGRILAQTSRSSGLAVVYNEILSFDGSELYFYEAPWGRKKFSKLVYHFTNGVPIGIRTADGTVTINPGPTKIMQPGDSVLILAEDDSTIRYHEAPVVRPRSFPPPDTVLEQTTESQLILGWHPITSIVVSEYADYLLEGSKIDIMVHNPSKAILDEIHRLQDLHSRLRINFINKNPMDMEDLRSVEPYNYDDVLILSQQEGFNLPEKIDSDTLVILLLLRKIFQERPPSEKETTLITQVMNSDNQELIAYSDVDDFIISNRFITMIMAQISEESDIKKVYDQLFQAAGSEIYLKPASLYFKTLPMKLSFADMINAADKRDEICIGIREFKYGKDPDMNFGVDLLPPKDQWYNLDPKDTLVVVATDEL